MKLPRRFRLVLTGNTIDVTRRENVNSDLAWYLRQLLLGAEMPEDVLKPWGITVEVEEDMDQGEG
jgi:hypothetical protein